LLHEDTCDDERSQKLKEQEYEEKNDDRSWYELNWIELY
jgi:hypothetical protein